METVLITGANRGIGLELASRYAAAGNRVLACCRDPGKADKLQALAKSRKGLTLHAVHVGDGKSVATLAAEIRTAPIDILINNAGMPGPSPDKQSISNMDFDGWAETFAVNTMAPLRMLQTFRRNLKAGKNPRAVTITSQMGALALNMPVMVAYCSSKAAVNKVMRMASVELANAGIAVGRIHPGWVKTDMGGAHAEITVEDSAAGIMSVIAGLALDNTGCFKKWNGEDHPW
ncbi:MAG: SDR family oxidoreductase [Proteobacteria bacterium]|nr:SDR family oxidoreductase [Pseudomonadota bacterium]